MLQWFLFGQRWLLFYLLCLIFIIAVSLVGLQLNYYFLFLPVYLIIFGLIFFVNFLPTLIFSLAGAFARPKQPTETVAQEFIEFIVIIPAYNEKQVILNSVTSLLAQKYGEHYTARIIVAFNGTDETGAIAEQAGAEVFTTPIPQCGKSKAIAYLLESIPAQDNRYVIIVDADNVVAEDYLDVIARACQSKKPAYQTNHLPLLVSENWVSKGLNAGYCASSRLFNIGRSRLLGSALLCGTGMVIREDVIRNLWSRVKTQTEDIELNGLLSLYYGSGVEWIETANFFDEKPDVIDVAIRQRVRWMVGHLRCFYHYGFSLLKQFLTKGDVRAFELAIYYLVPVTILASTLWLLMLIPIAILGYPYGTSNYDEFVTAFTLIILVYMILLPALGYYLQNTHIKSTIRLGKAFLYSLYAMLFATFVWPIAIIFACFSISSTTWIFHTPHKARAITHESSKSH